MEGFSFRVVLTFCAASEAFGIWAATLWPFHHWQSPLLGGALMIAAINAPWAIRKLQPRK